MPSVRGSYSGDSRGNHSAADENATRGRSRGGSISVTRLRQVGRYSYPPKHNFLHLGAGPWVVTLRDKRGRQFNWRTGLSYNQARAARKYAKRAHYRDPVIARKG